jgi:DNA-binding IscR family transcriptional regulator
MATIIRLVNGPIAMLPCVSLYFYERCKNCDEENCVLHDMMLEGKGRYLKHSGAKSSDRSFALIKNSSKYSLLAW